MKVNKSKLHRIINGIVTLRYARHADHGPLNANFFMENVHCDSLAYHLGGCLQSSTNTSMLAFCCRFQVMAVAACFRLTEC